MNTGWQRLTGGNTTPCSTRFAAHSTQMESGLGERERQTGRRTNSGQTQHLTRNRSHTIESWDLETGDAMTIQYF